MQVGSQRISSASFKEAKRLIEAGDIGQINYIESNSDRFKRHWGLELFRAARCLTADRRLGPVSGRCAEASVRPDPVFPLAELQGLRHGGGR